MPEGWMKEMQAKVGRSVNNTGCFSQCKQADEGQEEMTLTSNSEDEREEDKKPWPVQKKALSLRNAQADRPGFNLQRQLYVRSMPCLVLSW